MTTKTPLPRKRRKLNRVGSASHKPQEGEPQSLGARMAARRLDLRMTQAQIAKHVRMKPKSGRRRDVETALSRNAYAMYEIDNAEPDLAKIAAIAKALKCSPGWLAFGEISTAPVNHEAALSVAVCANPDGVKSCAPQQRCVALQDGAVLLTISLAVNGHPKASQ